MSQDDPIFDSKHADLIAELVGTSAPEPVALPEEVRRGTALANPFDPASLLPVEEDMVPFAGGGPSQSVRFAPVQTRHEGMIDYAQCWNFYVRRIGSHAYGRLDPDGSNFFKNVPPTRTADMRYLGETIYGAKSPLLRINEPPREEAEYLRLLVAWARLKQMPLVWDLNRFSSYVGRHGPRNEWGGAAFYADMHWREGTFLMGACNAVSVLFATLLLAGGMEPWRIGIFTARYQADRNGSVPSHVYNGIYLFNRWRYIDVQGVRGSLFPARTEADERPGWMALNIGVVDTCDYPHPFQGEMPQAEYWAGLPDIRLPAVPMLGAAPYEII